MVFQEGIPVLKNKTIPKKTLLPSSGFSLFPITIKFFDRVANLPCPHNTHSFPRPVYSSVSVFLIVDTQNIDAIGNSKTLWPKSKGRNREVHPESHPHPEISLSTVTSNFLVIKFGEHLRLHLPDATCRFKNVACIHPSFLHFVIFFIQSGANHCQSIFQKSLLLPYSYWHHGDQGIKKFKPNYSLSFLLIPI